MHKTMDIYYTLTPNNLHIEDSYKVSKRDFIWALSAIKYAKKDGLYPNMYSNVWKRTAFSLEAEWVCHNFLYSIGYKREQTKDVDLNYPCKIEWLYKVLGCLVWVFVK